MRPESQPGQLSSGRVLAYASMASNSNARAADPRTGKTPRSVLGDKRRKGRNARSAAGKERVERPQDDPVVAQALEEPGGRWVRVGQEWVHVEAVASAACTSSNSSQAAVTPGEAAVPGEEIPRAEPNPQSGSNSVGEQQTLSEASGETERAAPEDACLPGPTYGPETLQQGELVLPAIVMADANVIPHPGVRLVAGTQHCRECVPGAIWCDYSGRRPTLPGDFGGLFFQACHGPVLWEARPDMIGMPVREGDWLYSRVDIQSSDTTFINGCLDLERVASLVVEYAGADYTIGLGPPDRRKFGEHWYQLRRVGAPVLMPLQLFRRCKASFLSLLPDCLWGGYIVRRVCYCPRVSRESVFAKLVGADREGTIRMRRQFLATLGGTELEAYVNLQANALLRGDSTAEFTLDFLGRVAAANALARG